MAKRMSNSTLAIWAVVVVASGLLVWQAQKSAVPETTVAVTVPTLSSKARAGQTVFEKNCKVCHGKDAGGSSNGPPLVHVAYEPNHHADFSFVMAAKRGVRAHHWSFGNMPPVSGVSDDQIGQVITYIRELQRANGIN